MAFKSRNHRFPTRLRDCVLAVESLEDRRLLAFTGPTDLMPIIEPAPLPEILGEPDDSNETRTFASTQTGEIPILHSVPEATNKIFLDFDGNYERFWSDNEHVVTPPYDIDGDSDSFSEQEQARITEIWQRVAEDYAPFNIDVTTEDPADHTTELREVDASNNRIRTFYFRREFEINDPADIRDLQVGLLRDDGAAVFLNGTEIVRDNLGTNARFDSFATAGASATGERTYHPFAINSNLLVPGRNVISAEVHQRSDDSSDVSFDLELNATVLGQPNGLIIPQHSDWRYLDDGSNQGVAWQASDFDDSAWPIGTGEFGYGDVVATTHVAIGGSSSDWFDDGSGGVAFLRGFSRSGVTTAFVFARSVNNGAKNIAEAASHEAGHTFGLSHQGLYDEETNELIDEYNPGQDGWAPIMGVSYDQDLTTWHQGPTRTINTIQDNMDILSSNGGGYRADDHGDTAALGTSLTETLDNGFFSIGGIVERNTDRDAFTFTLDETQSGVSMSVTGIGIDVGQNLDAILELRDSNNEIIRLVDPEHAYDAAFEMQLAPGNYSVIVRSNGEYGRVGQYTLSGHVDEGEVFVADFDRATPLGSGAMSKRVSGAIDFEDDSDTFIVGGQPGQLLSAIVTPSNPLAVLSLSSSELDSPIIARNPGESIAFPTSLLTGNDATLEISSNVPGRYMFEAFINANAELGEGSRGSSIEAPSQIVTWQAEGTLFGTALGHSGDGTDRQSVLVPRGATWRFLDDGSNQRSAWRDSDFDDSGWTLGGGHFGYGDGDESVYLNENRTDGSRIRTFYFRHTFEVEDTSAIRDLTLRLLRDDGAAVYLNGTEVRRDNLASVASYNSLASRAEIENEFIDSFVDPNLLVTGQNVLAVEIHQNSDSSSDVSFEFELVANAIAQRQTTEFITTETAWKYLDDGSDQRVAWQKSNFVDTEWPIGTANFGYGDGDEMTRLERNDSAGQRIRTFYFRKQFEITDLSMVDELIAGINFDDGIAVYINGAEAARSNLSAKADYRTLADVSRRPEGVFDEFTIDTSLLNIGTNVIAVEVHQHDDTSSDVTFDMFLTGYQDATEIDAYEFEVSSAMVGQPFEIALFGQSDFSSESLTLLDPQGLAIATAVPVMGDAALAIRDVELSQSGTYSLQLRSDTSGDYQIAINSGVWPEYRLGTNELPLLSIDQPSGGYVNQSDTSDTYEFVVSAPGEFSLTLDYPFSEIDRSTRNDLNATIVIFTEEGRLVSASNDNRLTQSLQPATYHVEVIRGSGMGEYRLTASSQSNIPADADLNGDQVVSSLDIDHLCNGIRNADVTADLNGDGSSDLGDLELFVLSILESKFGDANLDGIFNSTDFVFVFGTAEYEDDLQGNSGWADGDWNCDGEFDTQDFVTAFTYNGYSAAAKLNTAPVGTAFQAARVSDDSESPRSPTKQVRKRTTIETKSDRPRQIPTLMVDAIFAR